MSDDYYDPMFCGTENHWKHPLWDLVYVDSVRSFCQEKEAWWTMDVIGSYIDRFKKHDFLVFTFDVNGNEATFTAKEDDGITPIVVQEIEYTDLPVSIKLYWESGIVLFPSDH